MYHSQVVRAIDLLEKQDVSQKYAWALRSRWTREKRRNTLEVLEDNWNKEEQTGLRRTGANAASMQFQEAEESRAREEPTMRLVEQNQALCALSAAASSFNLVIISLIIVFTLLKGSDAAY